MARIFKKRDVQFKEDPGRIENYKLFTAFPRLSSQANSKNLVFDLRLLSPGQFSFPYHFHRNAEEMMMIISGTLTVRSPSGFEELSEGDIVFFEIGEDGAHQFYNHSSEPCRYLDIRTLLGTDVVEYPDSGKINVLPAMEVFEKESKVSYFKGEEQTLNKWNDLKSKAGS
jgi:uncharacterized cupin superfamily protein